MPLAYAGKYIRVDLTTGEQRMEQILDEDVRKFYLGSGYAARRFSRTTIRQSPGIV